MRGSLLLLWLFISVAWAAFGWTTVSNTYQIDSGAGLIIRVNNDNGDITSILYNNIQLQDSSKFSHISSGLGSVANVFIATVATDYIKVTLETSTLTHYLIIKRGVNNIFMGTHVTQEPSVGELRFIARLRKSALPNGHPNSQIEGGSVIEGSDVFLVNGQTRSKFYSSLQFIDDQVHGATGNGVGAFMIIPGVGYESSSGGPFFRDINNQGSSQQEVYFYMNSGHTQTEAYRMGFHGPYVLAFTNGAAPSANIDTSFYSLLGLKGYVPISGRGYVRGSTSGVSPFPVVVAFKNANAQYWTRAASDGSYTSPPMKPGTYTVTLFKTELEVKTDTVTVSAGQTVTKNLASAEFIPSNRIFLIGEFDGTPRTFLNADKIERAHPSDSSMGSWGPITFNVGDNWNRFPMAVFKAANNPVTIRFTLSASQVGARTLRIATTLAFAGARPQVKVNNWTGPAPSAPSQPDSRGVTRGTWRGNNILYTVNIPSGVLVSGTNNIVITAISGSSGDMFLSPNFIFDAVDLF